MESVAIIGGVTYTAISAPIIDRACLGDTLSVGNCIAASMKVSILTDDDIPASAKVIIKARITDEVDYSEWLEMGTFYIDSREENSGLVTLQCYDSMLKAGQNYVEDNDTTGRIDWPQSMQACVKEIAARIGVAIDPRTVIKTTAPYQVPYPAKLTMMQVLGYIGACHGGNWVITPENKLRLIPLVPQPVDSFDIIDQDYNTICTNDGFELVWKHADTEDIVNPAGGGAIDVPVVVGKITTAKPMTISRVTIACDEDLGYTLGDSTGFELRIEENPYACQAICDDLYAALKGMVYAPFTIQTACYDPATELGDWIYVGDKVRSVLYVESATLNINFRANASAPGKDEMGSEYPYLGAIQRLQKADERLEKYMEAQKDEIHSRIDQTRTSILLEVAGTYATQDQVNTDLEILAGEITAEVTRATTADEKFESRLTLTESAITTEVSRAKGQEDALSSQIKQTADKIELKVSKGDISSQISVETGTVTIGSNRLVIESDNFKLSKKGKVSANGSITSEGSEFSTSLDDGGIFMYDNGTRAGWLRCDDYAWGDDDFGQVVSLQTFLEGLVIGSGDNYGSGYGTDYSFVYNNGLNTFGYNERFWFGEDMHVDGKIHTSDQIQFYGDPTWDNHWGAYLSGTYSSQGAEGVYVCGYLWVTEYLRVVGSKTRVVDTDTYGMVCLNAMESADAVFSDFGSGTLDDTGVAYIYFDQVFVETVDLLHDYYVLTTQTSEKQLAYVEKNSDYFVVHGTPGASFDWIVYAYQRGYTAERLEVDTTVEVGKDRADTSVFRGDNKGAVTSGNYMEEFKDTYDEQAAAYLEEYEQEVTDDYDY